MAISNILVKISLIMYIERVFGVPRLDPLVETKVGLIRGLKSDDGEYSMFLGIPFATVDESNPFGSAKPHEGFNETFDAYDDSAICPQVEEFNKTIVGTFDCLHLNIFVPRKASSQNRLPVLVWIYGGGFGMGFYGRYFYGPKYLIRHDIILVTINYRLGPYGFMCLDTAEVPGNQGLKDQLIALRWINDNIESFGGDTNKITIFGESAGGMSVDFHLLSDQEKLFSSVIMHSGNSLVDDLMGESDPKAPMKLAEKLGFPTNDMHEALSFLAATDPKLVIATTQQTDVSFKPCVEKDFDKVEKFIKDYPVNLKVPKSKAVNILLGFNNNEAMGFYGASDPGDLASQNIFHSLLINIFDFPLDDLMKFEEIVTHFYLGDEKSGEALRNGIINVISDFRFLHPTKRSVLKYLDNGAERIFHFMFSYDGPRNYYKNKNNVTIKGAAHADEVAYMFDVSFMTEEPTSEDQLTIDRMTTMWANFVKYGNPTPDTSDLLPVKWEPITTNSPYYYMNIDSELEMNKSPFKERFAFWDLFYVANGKFQRGYRDTQNLFGSKSKDLTKLDEIFCECASKD